MNDKWGEFNDAELSGARKPTPPSDAEQFAAARAFQAPLRPRIKAQESLDAAVMLLRDNGALNASHVPELIKRYIAHLMLDSGDIDIADVEGGIDVKSHLKKLLIGGTRDEIMKLMVEFSKSFEGEEMKIVDIYLDKVLG